jgi:hypothetical protein
MQNANNTAKHWHECYLDTQRVVFNVADIILLKYPLYITIEGLNPVPIMYFLVSTEPINKDPRYMYLIGLDVLNQHTWLYSQFDGKKLLKITNLREEIL